MDAEINTALAVFFLGLRKRIEMPRPEIANLPGVIDCHPVEFVRGKSERDIICVVETAEDLEKRATEAAVTRRVGREGWGEIRAGQVTGWRTERIKARIAQGGGVAVAETRWAGAGIRFTNAGNRAPILVMEFRLPDGDAGIGEGNVNQRKQAGELERTGGGSLLCRDLHRELIVKP